MGKCKECGHQTKENLRYCYDCWTKQKQAVKETPNLIKDPSERSHAFTDKVLGDFDYTFNRVSETYSNFDEKLRVAVALAVLKATSHRLNSYYSTRKRESATRDIAN